MKTLTLEIQDDNIAEKVLWMLKHFKDDGLVISENNLSVSVNLHTSIKQSVDEMNMIKSDNLKAKPISDLLNVL